MAWQFGWPVFAGISCLVAVLAFALIWNHPGQTGRLPYGRAAPGAAALLAIALIAMMKAPFPARS